jgi:hypothetical protein
VQHQEMCDRLVRTESDNLTTKNLRVIGRKLDFLQMSRLELPVNVHYGRASPKEARIKCIKR